MKKNHSKNNNSEENSNNDRNGGGRDKRDNQPKGTKVGDWCAVRQIGKINSFLDSNMVKKLTEIEYYRQIDYWYKACRYGVYSTPVSVDDIENLRQQDENMQSMGLFSPNPDQVSKQSPNELFSKLGSDNVDNEDEFNTTTFLDKTSTVFGYGHDDITTINMNGIETNISDMVNSNLGQDNNDGTAHVGNYPKFAKKLDETIEQYLYTRKMWQKYKPSRINAQYSSHPQLLAKPQPQQPQQPQQQQQQSAKKGQQQNQQKGSGSLAIDTTAEIDSGVISYADLDHSDLTAVREALFTWYSSLRYQTPAEQALSSNMGYLSPMTPPSLTGPLPILSWNPSLWYVNFIMALLHTFFPAFQFQPSASVVSVRNLFGPAIKFTLPPISKVFGFWLHDASLNALTGGSKMDNLMTHNVTNASRAPGKETQGYLYDHYINKCQYYGLDGGKYHHISELPPVNDDLDKHHDKNQDKQQDKNVGKKGGKNNNNNAAKNQEKSIEPNVKQKERGITWYRGYNATLAQTSYNHLEDIVVVNTDNNAIKFDQNGQIIQDSKKTMVNKALPEEEIGKTNNNKKSLYPCLPDHIKSVLFGRERYFCSTFVSMKITSVYQDIWNTAINFPLTLLTSSEHNANFKAIIQQYRKSVQDVLETMSIESDIVQNNNLPITVGYQQNDYDFKNNKNDGKNDGKNDKSDKSDKKPKNKTIKVQIQPQNLRFPPVEITLSYVIVADIDDEIAKNYCEENGIIYDQNSLQNSKIFTAGEQTQFDIMDSDDEDNIGPKKDDKKKSSKKNKEKKSSSNDTGLQSDELRDSLGSQYTYPCQIMLEISGVNMNLLRTHAPKLYCWFLCTLSRLHSIAIFVEKKAKILEPLILMKNSELEFNTRFNSKNSQNNNNNNNNSNTDISPADAKLNTLLSNQVAKMDTKTVELLLLQPRSIQLVSASASNNQKTSRDPSTQRNLIEIGAYGVGAGSNSSGQSSSEFGLRRHNLMKSGGNWENNNPHNFNENDNNAAAVNPLEQTPEQLIRERELALASLDSILVGPVPQQYNNKNDQNDEENDQNCIASKDEQMRVINPTYSLSIIEQQSLSQFLPGIFIIQYTNWPFAINTPTISFHNELGGNALITSTDKLLPILIKHKITQSDVFSPLIEAELQAQLAVLASHDDSMDNTADVDPTKSQIKDEWPIPDVEVKSRVDLRKMLIFSIDPLTAKDLDDTLSMEYIGLSSQWPSGYFSNLPTGGSSPRAVFRVGVHIADVSFFVRSNTLLDQEACSRSTSVYLSTFVIPMLPRILCEELCSLNQGKDRLAFSCFFLMDDEGTVLEIDRHIRAKNTIRFDDNIIEIVTKTKDNGGKSDNLVKIGSKSQLGKSVYTLTDLVEPTLPIHKVDKSKPATFNNMGELEAQLRRDAEQEYDSLDQYGKKPANYVKNLKKAPKFDQNGKKIKYHNDLSDDDGDDNDGDYDEDDYDYLDEGKQIGYISGSDDDNEEGLLNANFINSEKGQENLTKALGDLSIDPLSSMSTRKRGKAPERRKKMAQQNDGDDSDDENDENDENDEKVQGKGGNKFDDDKGVKDTVTPHEAWSKYVTESSWYGKSIIRSALKLDYRTAMLLVECAFLDPEYETVLKNRDSFVQNFAKKYKTDDNNQNTVLPEPPSNFDKLSQQYQSQQQEVCLLSTRASSIPLECAQLEAFSPLDISLQLGLHSDEAIMRQINAHSELSELFLADKGRCRPAGFCSKFYDAKAYKMSPKDVMDQGHGQENIPDIARACRLLHSLGMKRRQERLTTLGSLTLTRNKLSFKFGYQMDHWLQENPNILLTHSKDEHKIDSKKSKFESILLPTEIDRSVQHYTMYPLYDTNRMIEEYMLLGNEFVAKRIYRILPKHALLRKHPNPDENKLTLTTSFLNKLGVPLQTASAGILQKSLVSLQQSYDRTIERILRGEFDLSNPGVEIKVDNNNNNNNNNNDEKIHGNEQKLFEVKKGDNFDQKVQDKIDQIKNEQNHDENNNGNKRPRLGKFEEVCWRLYQAGCDVRSIAEELFAQTMIAAQYFPTGVQQLDKEKLTEISKQFNIQAPVAGKKTPNAAKFFSKKPAQQKSTGFKGPANKSAPPPSAKTQRQFKWALEREWITNFKHYALNMDFYTHFTSPIRRYPDIIVHRVLECSLFIEPASNQLPSSPFYKEVADSTIDDIFFNHKIGKNGLEHDHNDLLLDYKPYTGTAKSGAKKITEESVDFMVDNDQNDQNDQNDGQKNNNDPQLDEKPEWVLSDIDLLQKKYATRFEQDMSVFDLVRILPHPSIEDEKALKIKGVSQSLSNSQLYIKTTTPQLVLQQCEQFNKQKSEAKYAGDDSSNLTFCELILRRQYQLNWLLTHTVNNEYQNPQDILHYLMERERLRVDFMGDGDSDQLAQVNAVSNSFTPLNSIPNTPESIGMAFAQQFFVVEQPLLTKMYNINDRSTPELEKVNTVIKKYISSLKLTIKTQIDFNAVAFVTLLTQKAIAEGKSPSSNPEVTKQYILNFFLKAPILVERGVVMGATNRSLPGQLAIFIPSTQQTVQLTTDTPQQNQIVPKLIDGVPVAGNNVGCTILQGDYLLVPKSQQGFNVTGEHQDDVFVRLLQNAFVDQDAGRELELSRKAQQEQMDADYGQYEDEYDKLAADERELFSKNKLDISGKGTGGDKNSQKNILTSKFDEDKKGIKKDGIHTNSGKKTNAYASAIQSLSMTSMWLVTWDPLFAPLAWFEWAPIAHKDKEAVKKIEEEINSDKKVIKAVSPDDVIKGNTLTLEDCTEGLPRYIPDGVWDNFVTKHEQDLVFLPKAVVERGPREEGGKAEYISLDDPTAAKKTKGKSVLFDENDEESEEKEQTAVGSITKFTPFTEGIRLFDTVRVVLLPQIPELTFKPILIPNLVVKKQ